MSKFRRFPVFAVLVALAAASIPAISLADAKASEKSAHCLLREHRITSVSPYRVNEQIGRQSATRLRGAEVIIQAEAGLTAEWLQLTLSRHIAEMNGSSAMPDCALGVDDVKVRVESTGTGFRVLLIAKDSGKAAEVLRRAELLAS